MVSYFQKKQVQNAFLGFFIIAIFLTYWLFSRQYTGPAYLSDEIGYLSKAAAFAGYPVDMASSWHGGYSLILSPLFMVFTDPYIIWQVIMVLNAAMWAVSFTLLFYLLSNLFPEKNFWFVFAAVAISAIYPSWITMSGYAFSTSSFVLIYMLAIFTLLKTDITKAWNILPHSLFVGFLYWIHPTGLAVVVASFLVAFGLAWNKRRFKSLFLHIIVMITMLGVYKLGIHEWLNLVMTPENYTASSHYKSISSVLQSFLNIDFWKSWFVITLGQSSYLVIASFGLVSLAVVETWRRLKFLGLNKAQTKESTISTSASMMFIILSVFGILLLGSLSFATGYVDNGELRLDHWIYGRYTEVALLPLLGIGFLAFWRFKYFFSTALFIFASGLVLNLFTNETNTISNNNLVNIQSFWPQALFNQESFIFWFIIGMFGIIAIGLLKKKLFVVVTIPLFLACIFNQNVWHQNILSSYSKPSGLVELVRSNFEYGKPLGFDPSMPEQATGSQIERRNLYSYYFSNYDYRRMSPEVWLASGEGPYLTYRGEKFSNLEDVKVIAREASSGLFLVVKKNVVDNLSIQSDFYNDLYIDLSGDNTGLISGCYSMSSSDIKFSQVGNYIESKLSTSSKNGYLFYGPYVPLKKGDYYIRIEGNFINPEGAVLDITSNHGTKKYLEIKLDDYVQPYSNSIRVPFSIEDNVNDIEVRLNVNSETKLEFDRYTINVNTGEVTKSESNNNDKFFSYDGNNTIPTQVGIYTGNGIQKDGQWGYLLFGSYRPMDAGEYVFQVTGEVRANSQNGEKIKGNRRIR